MANGTNWSSRKNAYYVQWRRNRKAQNQQQQPTPAPAPPPQAAAPQQAPQQPPQPPQQPQQPPQMRQSPIVNLQRGYSQTAGQRTNSAPPSATSGTTERLNGVYQPGYDANGNAAVQKWQGQSDDTKASRFLAGVHNNVQMQNYDPATGAYGSAVDAKTGQVLSDGYGFYQGDYQNFSLALGLNDKPTVISDAQFNRMVKSNGLQVVYRGDTGDAQIDRFMNATYSHTGVGSYGDGFYFSDKKSTANDYAASKAYKATGNSSNGRVLKMALSPNARIISYTDLQTAMSKAGASLKSALHKQGHSAQGANYWNSGEAQFALKMGYNVIAGCGYSGSDYHYALTRDAFIVSDKVIKAR